MQSKGAFNANMPPSLAGQTNVPLDGASFMIAVAAGALADIKALDVEVM